ncbi:MAG: hypothetical protein Ct9H300mP25_11620 [Acidobacteriota bacterium]|nr:MAG: hypothetical protein Ct9H300mP25_11620 [Acidobacteriota bacterium]
MTDLSQNLRTELAQDSPFLHLRFQSNTSSDGTVKFLMKLKDDRQVESGFYPRHTSNDLLRSTQGFGFRHAMHILPNRKNGVSPQPKPPGDCRTSQSYGPRAQTFGPALQHCPHGNG